MFVVGYGNYSFGEVKGLENLRADSPPHIGIVVTLLRTHADWMISRLLIERPRSSGWRRLGRRARKRRCFMLCAKGFGSSRGIGWLSLLVLRYPIIGAGKDAFSRNRKGIDQQDADDQDHRSDKHRDGFRHDRLTEKNASGGMVLR